MKGKQIWKENKIDQKRTQKRTEGTEKKQFFRKGKKEKMSDVYIAFVYTINKIWVGENTSRGSCLTGKIR